MTCNTGNLWFPLPIYYSIPSGNFKDQREHWSKTSQVIHFSGRFCSIDHFCLSCAATLSSLFFYSQLSWRGALSMDQNRTANGAPPDEMACNKLFHLVHIVSKSYFLVYMAENIYFPAFWETINSWALFVPTFFTALPLSLSNITYSNSSALWLISPGEVTIVDLGR